MKFRHACFLDLQETEFDKAIVLRLLDVKWGTSSQVSRGEKTGQFLLSCFISPTLFGAFLTVCIRQVEERLTFLCTKFRDEEGRLLISLVFLISGWRLYCYLKTVTYVTARGLHVSTPRRENAADGMYLHSHSVLVFPAPKVCVAKNVYLRALGTYCFKRTRVDCTKTTNPKNFANFTTKCVKTTTMFVKCIWETTV